MGTLYKSAPVLGFMGKGLAVEIKKSVMMCKFIIMTGA